MKYFRKTARYNGKKYEATGKTGLEALQKLAEKLAAAKRGENAVGGSMTVDAWYKEWKSLYSAFPTLCVTSSCPLSADVVEFWRRKGVNLCRSLIGSMLHSAFCHFYLRQFL